MKFLLAAFAFIAITAHSKALPQLDQERVPGEFIVKYKTGFDRSVTETTIKNFGAEKVHSLLGNTAELVRLPKGFSYNDEASFIESMMKTGDVKYVEPNFIYHATDLPNDEQFSELFGMHNDGSQGSEDADIDALEAWDIQKGSRNVVIGVIDTGIDYNHPDLKNNMWTNPGETGIDANGNDKSTNGIDDDNNGYIDDFRGWDFVNNDNDPMDDNKHGTHCAGTIGAEGNNGVGVVGVNWQVSMVAIKFLSGGGSGSLDGAVRAIEYATTLGLFATSNSWGGGGFSETMSEAIARNQESGALFIAAAGNSSMNNDSSPHYPSSYSHDNIIAVASHDIDDQASGFSCYGLQTVDVFAPGTDILSSIPNGGYEKLSGTSMATPHVAGVAALIKAEFPDASASEIKTRIMMGTEKKPQYAGKVASGGRVSAFNSLERDNEAPARVSGISVDQVGRTTAVISFNPTGDDGDRGEAATYEFRILRKEQMGAPWADATPVSASMESGERNTLNLIGLPINFEGEVLIRALDNVGNASEVSRIGVEVQKGAIKAIFDGRTTSSIELTDRWNYVGNREGNLVISDSPEGEYENRINSSVILHSIPATGNVAVVNLTAKYDIERHYDNAHVEYQIGEGAWVTIESLTGSASHKVINHEINGVAGQTINLRVKLVTDDSVTKDGIEISNMSIVEYD